MSLLMRSIAMLALVILLLLMVWFIQGAERRTTPQAVEEAAQEVTEQDTATGLGVANIINPGGVIPPDPGSAPVATESPADETVVETGTPENTVSPRDALYEEAELELLRRELEADINDEMARRELRKQAMRSPIGASTFTFGGQTDGTGQVEPERPGPSALPTLPPSLADLTTAPDSAQQERQSAQASPAATGTPAPAGFGYSPHRIQAPQSPYELRKGTVIPGLLSTGINSDIPGFVSGTVRLDVFDTVTGQHLLIPAGSRVFGRYDPETTYGQQRLDVVWTDLMFPDGDVIVLEGQQATDGAGRSGFADRRKGNFLRTLGGNLLYSIIETGEQAAQVRIEEAITGSAPERGGLGSALEGLSSGLSGGGGTSSAAALFNRQQSQLKPTLIIRPGYPFNILVARDLVLEPRG